jgi:hypothetical protein
MSAKNLKSTCMKFEQLQEFPQLADECLGNAKDATFELADAVMTTRHVSYLGDLARSSFISA